jgi:hypothetical protein
VNADSRRTAHDDRELRHFRKNDARNFEPFHLVRNDSVEVVPDAESVFRRRHLRGLIKGAAISIHDEFAQDNVLAAFQ